MDIEKVTLRMWTGQPTLWIQPMATWMGWHTGPASDRAILSTLGWDVFAPVDLAEICVDIVDILWFKMKYVQYLSIYSMVPDIFFYMRLFCIVASKTILPSQSHDLQVVKLPPSTVKKKLISSDDSPGHL